MSSSSNSEAPSRRIRKAPRSTFTLSDPNRPGHESPDSGAGIPGGARARNASRTLPRNGVAGLSGASGPPPRLTAMPDPC